MQSWNDFAPSTVDTPGNILFDEEVPMLRASVTMYTAYETQTGGGWDLRVKVVASPPDRPLFQTLIIVAPDKDRYVLHPTNALPPARLEPGLGSVLITQAQFPPSDPAGEYRIYALLTDEPLDGDLIQAWLDVGDTPAADGLAALWNDTMFVYARPFRLAHKQAVHP